jgi:ELMO domain-containing protein
VGRQSKDPTTDLRGMGVLGLYTLVYFVERYPTVAHAIVHSGRAYPFAAVGINVTQMLCSLLGLTDGPDAPPRPRSVFRTW